MELQTLISTEDCDLADTYQQIIEQMCFDLEHETLGARMIQKRRKLNWQIFRIEGQHEKERTKNPAAEFLRDSMMGECPADTTMVDHIVAVHDMIGGMMADKPHARKMGKGKGFLRFPCLRIGH